VQLVATGHSIKVSGVPFADFHHSAVRPLGSFQPLKPIKLGLQLFPPLKIMKTPTSLSAKVPEINYRFHQTSVRTMSGAVRSIQMITAVPAPATKKKICRYSRPGPNSDVSKSGHIQRAALAKVEERGKTEGREDASRNGSKEHL
jgi:hypothetical protein